MTKLYNKNLLRGRRKNLRNNVTKEETILWECLKNYFKHIKFRRQYSVGPYILDFYSRELRLAIELDGFQHLDNKEYDQERDAFLNGKNITVLRFWNDEIRNNLLGVIDRIQKFTRDT
jgi:very-short-patch-repair endonuclease